MIQTDATRNRIVRRTHVSPARTSVYRQNVYGIRLHETAEQLKTRGRRR